MLALLNLHSHRLHLSRLEHDEFYQVGEEVLHERKRELVDLTLAPRDPAAVECPMDIGNGFLELLRRPSL